MQRGAGGGFWPPGEMTLREALETQPEALTIVDQKLESGRAAVAEQKDSSGERVLVEVVAAQRGEPINALTEIDRLISKHDPDLRRELDHGLGAKKS